MPLQAPLNHNEDYKFSKYSKSISHFFKESIIYYSELTPFVLMFPLEISTRMLESMEAHITTAEALNQKPV